MAQNKKLLKWSGSEGSCNRYGRTCRAVSSARLEDLFHHPAQNFNARQLIEIKSINTSNPFQVSGSVEMPSSSARRGTFHELQEKRAPWGLLKTIGNRPLGARFSCNS
jgi:hypothetical protein